MPNVPIVNLWTGLLAMGAVALLSACFIVQLREWGVRPLGDVSRWLHRPWIERGLLLFLICGMVDAANGFVYGREPRDSRRAQFYEPLISGDSGNPRFLLIGDRLVLLNVTYSGQGGGGSQLTRFAGEMEDAMNELSGTNGVYRLQRIDLSDFELLQETLDGEGGES